MSSVKTIPLAGAPPSTRFTLKIAFSTTPARESIVAVTKSTASRARSKLLTLNSDISQLPSPRNRAMAGWSAGYQAARVRRQLTPGPISSSPGTAGLPPFISFSTSYRELDSAVRRPMRRIGKRRETGDRREAPLKRDLSSRLGMAPDLVAAGTGTVELETKRSETAGNFPVGKSCEASHLRDRNRNPEFALRPNLAPEHRGEPIAVFPAGLHDFSGEALSDFDRFGKAAAFGYQSGYIWAGTQIAAIL